MNQFKMRQWTAVLCLAAFLAAAVSVGSVSAASQELSAFVVSCDLGSSAKIPADQIISSIDGIRGIVITSLPSADCGKLMLNGKEVALYDTISKTQLTDLSFESSSYAQQNASFSFRAFDAQDFVSEGSTVTMVLDGNEPEEPTGHTVTVFAAVPISETLATKGTVVIDSMPTLGTLAVEGTRYTYTPYLGKTGNDEFTFHVEDETGLASSSATVALKIASSDTVNYYDDLEGHWAHHAALTLTKSGILSGRTVGDVHLFDPNQTVSRGEFLMMAIKVAGVEDLPVVENTGLADDADIPSYLKGYVAYGLEHGILSGETTDAGLCFQAGAAITRSQAAAVLDRALSLTDAPYDLTTYSDADQIPVWSAQGLSNLQARGILTGFEDGTLRPYESLTRDQCAQILCNVLNETRPSTEKKTANVFSTVLGWFR